MKTIAFFSLAVLIGLAFASGFTYAAEAPFYEGKTIRIIVGFTAGGGYDAYARAIGRHMGKHIPGNPTVIVDNMPGAGSVITANHVYKVAKPDGLSMLFVLGYISKNPPSSSYQNLAKNLFDNCIVYQAGKVTSPRAWAWIIMGCIFYLQKFSGAMLIKKICRNLSAKLLEVDLQHRSSSWQWFENIVTYDNARMPQAKLMAGKYFKNKEYIKVVLDSLDWLYTNQYNKEDNFISLIGNENWFVKGKKKSKYDQQPLEIPGLIGACFQAYKITKDEEWILRLNLAFSWFLGNNERREVLHDYSTGGCFDGLSSSVLNLNQGAESTLSWLWSLHRLIKIREDLLIK